MRITIVGKCATGKTTLLKKFIECSGGDQVVAIDNCTLDLYRALFNDYSNPNVLIVVVTQDEELVALGDLTIRTSSGYSKIVVDGDGNSTHFHDMTNMNVVKHALKRVQIF